MSRSIIPLTKPSFIQLEEGSHLNVDTYFYWMLGEPLKDPHGEPMEIASPCGLMYKQAIDAARALYPYCENAGEGDRCIDVARQAVLVMMNG